MALVLLTDKVRVEEDVAHPRREREAAGRTIFCGQATVAWLHGKVDGGIECGDACDALRTELRADDEGEVPTCRKATEGDAIGVVHVGL